MTKVNALKIQLYINLVLAVLLVARYHDIYCEVYLGILILALLVRKNKKLFQLISILFLPIIFINQFIKCMRLLIEILPNMSVIMYILYLAGLLVVIIPVTKEAYGAIKKPIFQLLATIWSTITIGIGPSIELNNMNQDGFLVGLNKSDLVFALVILVYVYLVTKIWNYNFSFSFSTFKGKKLQFISFIIIFVVTIWLILFHFFMGLAQNWQEIFWNWDFSLINPGDSAYFKNVWRVYLTAIEAGINEEVTRYIDLLLLLVVLKNKKWQIEGAVLGSAILFALPHIGNAFSSELRLSAAMTTFQVIDTFGFGCFAAALILYSGKLWVTVVIHALYDFLVFSSTPLTQIGMGLFGGIWGGFSYAIISLIIWVVFSIFILVKYPKLIRHNIQIMTKNQSLI